MNKGAEDMIRFESAGNTGEVALDPGLLERVRRAVDRTHAYYRSNQQPEGYWCFELESNVSVTAEYLMFLTFLGISDELKNRKMARYILQRQAPDGTWALYGGGPADLSTTVEAYFALRIAGFSGSEPPLEKTKDFIIANGGPDYCRLFTKIFLALFGEMDWRMVPSIPVEMILLPLWVPLNLYNFSSFARATIVPLSVIRDQKPVKLLPDSARVGEELRPMVLTKTLLLKKALFLSWKRFFLILDWVAESMDRASLRVFRPGAMKKAKTWILKHQEPTGDWAGIQPAMVHSVIALSTLGHSLSSEPIRRGLNALSRFVIEDEDGLRLQASISPVWDTGLTSLALLVSGLPKEDPMLARSAKWLAQKQIHQKGDWSIKRPFLEPGGWAFEFDNKWYPDLDDTSVTLVFLHRCKGEGGESDENLRRGVHWVTGMQGKDGGWGAFDVDSNFEILNQIPFADLEAMTDPSTADITGRVLQLLGTAGYSVSDEIVQRALQFLRRIQEPDGSWWGRWGVNYIYGTWSVLMGLHALGEDMDKPYVTKAVQSLVAHQNKDGGWGESYRSYEEPAFKMTGESTPSQTAWAVMALIAAGHGLDNEAVRGIEFLLERQKPDGTWDEEAFTGTGVPKYFPMRYHNYRNCFPLMALGMFLGGSSQA